MAEYDGDRASFSAGGFKYALEHGYGHEMFNFRAIDDVCYGYVPPTGNLRLEKHFDVDRNAATLDGATIVWTAPHPEQGGRAVVGVWRNATVFRSDQEATGKTAKHRRVGPKDIAGYRCKAKARDCLLLEPSDRPIFVRPSQPRTGGSWPGQQKVFYPKSGSTAMKRLKSILADIEFSNPSSNKSRLKKAKKNHSNWMVDVERRKQIEVAAIMAVGSRLEGMGYHVKSVERDNVGFDLLATRKEEVLHIEVKGRSGRDVSAELTVNERSCLKQYVGQKRPRAHYRIVIVTEALANPVITEFALVDRVEEKWCTLDGKWMLKFEDRTAAKVTATLLE